ncbi:HAMP domain-containing methyl-accepting chemotaxis protein [Nitrospira moscoviensis]|uniref:Putative Methyl-accepting chemotaxis protein n=1 Tax=Nitrospira moscoviensis TaxID=42253 RepID=A0A0K2GBC4_NITMO|nr:methyl-accepting chemotaxis protein [Nitrospira moscoviensis]ALA58266.1 putative Methyl-accepting chemotaxis protein [Nitrospira moscoviensis]
MARHSKASKTWSVQSWFQNLKTLPKLIVGFSAVGAIMIMVGLVGLIGLNKLKGELQTIYDGSTLALSNTGISSTNLGLYHDALLGAGRHTRKGDFEEAIAPLAELKKQTLAPLDAYQASELHESSTGRNEGKDLAALKAALKEYFASAEGAVGAFADSYASSLSDDQKQAMRDLGNLALSVEVANKYSTATLRVRELMSTIREIAKELNESGQAEATYRTNVVLLGGFVALLLGGAIGYFLARYIARNIVHVADVAEQAAAGNLQARAKLESDDEVGHMAKAFNSMLDRITALVSTEEERDMMQKRLMNFLVLVSEVGKGDLTKRGEVTADMFGNLADGFNLMIQRFAQLMKQVRESAERVNRSAGALRDNAGQMAGTAKHQADESVKALSAVEQLAVSMRQVAETAGASSESARQVLQATERGRVAVQETVQDMQSIRSAVQRMSKQVKALGDRSLEISQIVSTIREIANQTNLLALNAAIEAAGAGEAGARFAVVADQVRKLAESSTQATREIADLVKVIQSETQDAVVAMEHETQAVEAGSASALRTGDVFKEISAIAQRSAELAQTIAASAANQTASTDQVGRSIKDFTGGAVATQKATDSARATVEDMAKLAESLTASVAQFKLA